MEVTPNRLRELAEELKMWATKISATRKEVESLAGKLRFICNIVKQGRIFLARIFNWLHTMERGKLYTLNPEAIKDIHWWIKFLPTFNGVSVAWMFQYPQTDCILATDTCLQGCGGICGKEYFRARFPKKLADQHHTFRNVGLDHWT